MKTYRVLVLISVTLVILSGFFSSGIPQVHASGESPDAEKGLHTVPTNGGVYDTLTQVEMVTPINTDAENWTCAYEASWFMDEAANDTGGLPLRAVESTSTNITWQAILENPPSLGNHSFTFRVTWSNNSLLDGLLEWTSGLYTKDYSGSFIITHAYMHYGFDESLNWTVVGGIWSVLNGSLAGFSGGEGLVYAGDMMWNDCVLAAKVKIAADSPRAEAAFCVCFVDSGNFYWVGLGCWGHKVSISRTVDSVAEELVFSGDGADVVKDVWYNLSIKVSGNAISLYVNDVFELVVNDSTFSSGFIGVRTWSSHVLVDHVTVSGLPSTTMPSIGLQCGFVTQRSSYNAWTDDLLDEIKNAGFGSILIEHWMGKEQRRDGTYDETRLANGKKLFDKIEAAGLTPIIDLRVALYPDMRNYYNGYTTWSDGNPHADWVVLTETGKERFIDCWRKLIQTYNPSIISLWHFPGHNGGFDNARDAYMSTWGPEVVRRIREFYDGEIIFTLPYQGSRESAGSKSYWLSYYDPLPDDCDVIYGVGHMLYWNTVSNPSKEWDYDYAQLEKDFEGIARYVNLGKRVCSIEFGGLEYTVGSKPLQSRLDYLDAVCKKMAFYNVPWLYHVCRPQGRYTGGDNIIENLNTQAIQPDILNVLRKNIIS